MKFLIFLCQAHGNGGIERSASILTNELIKKGFEVEIISFASKQNSFPIKYNENIKIHYLNFEEYKTENYLKKIINISKKIKKTRKLIKEINPDFIYSYGTFANFYNILSGFSYKRMISERISFNSKNFSGKKKSFFVKKLLIRILYPFVKLVSVSKRDLEAYTFLTNKEVLYNPLFPKKDLNLEKENIILAVGRLTPQKGYDLILERIDDIHLDGWRFIILGEGPEETKLKELSKCKVEFHGFQDPHEYYAKAKIFLLPSRYEGFPNVLAEAMQYGCVPIAFDCETGPSEILTKENGILVENKNVKEFIKSLNYLIENEDIREEMSKEASKNDMFSTEKHVNNFLRIVSTIN